MLSDAPMGRTPFGDDEDWHDGDRPPSKVHHDTASHSRLDIDPAERLLHIVDFGLHLNRDQKPGRGVEGDHVVTPAVTEVVEAELHPCIPAVMCEQRRSPVLDRGMSRIGQGVEGGPLPTHLQGYEASQGTHAVSQAANGQAIEPVSLKPGDRLLRKVGSLREVFLTPASFAAKGADAATDRETRHASRYCPRDYRALIAA